MTLFNVGARMLARGGSAVVASAVMALGTGCLGGAYVGSPPSVEAQPVAIAPAPAEDDGDVVYVDAPPAVDVETYPTVVYGGVNVYYVDGRWYQRGARGWAYYRQEPPELGRQRGERWSHDHDPRWGRDDRGDRGDGRAVTEMQRSEPGGQPAPKVQRRRRGETVEAPAPKPAPRGWRRRAPAPTTR